MKLKKEITFVYSDSAEKSIYTLLVDEAEKRGYRTKLTNDKFEKCEIGFYCQHINFPENSRFSLIMLHDSLQQYSHWPDLWYREPWNKYDVGILPSEQWVDNWNKCSQWYYARPKRGMYKVGWPKADVIIRYKDRRKKEEFYKKYNLDINKRTVLYAPAWENDGKQDDFVRSMLKLDVNILIKQWDAPIDKFPNHVRCVNEMYELHKNIPQVRILPPSTNIFDAIAVSDVLVSEESSTMCEAAMMEVPSISVSNWLIPDKIPSRYPKCDYDFVQIVKKENLTEKVQEILNNYDYYKDQIKEVASKNFLNIGNSSKMIIDIIDHYVEGKDLSIACLVPQKKIHVPFKKNLKRINNQWTIRFRQNYNIRYPYAKIFYMVLRNTKHFIKKILL